MKKIIKESQEIVEKIFFPVKLMMFSENHIAVFEDNNQQWFTLVIKKNKIILDYYDLEPMKLMKHEINENALHSFEELISSVELWKNKIHLLKLIHSSFDDFSDKTVLLFINQTEELLKNPELNDFVSARYFGLSLSDEISLDRALDMSKKSPLVYSFYKKINDLRLIMSEVNDLIIEFIESKDVFDFDDFEKSRIFELLVDNHFMMTANESIFNNNPDSFQQLVSENTDERLDEYLEELEHIVFSEISKTYTYVRYV